MTQRLHTIRFSTVIPAKAGIQSFPFFQISVSPLGDLLSLACARESRQRETHPGHRSSASLRSTLRCAPPSGAPERRAGSPRSGDATAQAHVVTRGRGHTHVPLPGRIQARCAWKPAPPYARPAELAVLAETSECGCAARRRPRCPTSEGQKQTSGVLLGFPFGDAEKRSGLRGRRRGLSEPPQGASSAAAEDCEHRRGVPARKRRNRHRRVAFFWPLFLAKQEKWLGEAETKT